MSKTVIVDIMAAILAVAVITVLARSAATQDVITAIGNLFSGSIRSVIQG